MNKIPNLSERYDLTKNPTKRISIQYFQYMWNTNDIVMNLDEWLKSVNEPPVEPHVTQTVYNFCNWWRNTSGTNIYEGFDNWFSIYTKKTNE